MFSIKPETHKQLSALYDLMDDGDTIVCYVVQSSASGRVLKLFCHRILVDTT